MARQKRRTNHVGFRASEEMPAFLRARQKENETRAPWPGVSRSSIRPFWPAGSKRSGLSSSPRRRPSGSWRR
jgi:hypothetical protein